MLVLNLIKDYMPPRQDHRQGGNRKLTTFAICPVCNCIFGPLPRLDQKFCSYECKSIAQMTGRKSFRKARPEARRAQNLIRYYVNSGMIQRPLVCEECGKTECTIEAAHYDYAQSLVVRWLCISCHRKWDKQRPKQGTIRVQMINEKTPASAGVTEESK